MKAVNTLAAALLSTGMFASMAMAGGSVTAGSVAYGSVSSKGPTGIAISENNANSLAATAPGHTIARTDATTLQFSAGPASAYGSASASANANGGNPSLHW